MECGWLKNTVRALAILVLIGACTHAQPGCPAVSFQAAVSANLKPTASSHITLARQSDGSYTAYEMTDASPYRIIRTTPRFGTQLTECLSKQPALPPLPPPQDAGFSPGTPSQAQIFARLPSGDYLLVQPMAANIGFTISLFDSALSLITETKHSEAVSGVLFG